MCSSSARPTFLEKRYQSIYNLAKLNMSTFLFSFITISVRLFLLIIFSSTIALLPFDVQSTLHARYCHSNVGKLHWHLCKAVRNERSAAYLSFSLYRRPLRPHFPFFASHPAAAAAAVVPLLPLLRLDVKRAIEQRRRRRRLA
jgi:hypothetical protein